MPMKNLIPCAFAGLLFIAAPPPLHGQLLTLQKMGPDVYVQVRMETTGEANLGAWSGQGGAQLAPLLPLVLRCQQGLKMDEAGGSAMRCTRALNRNGLALEAVLDLAPIARELNGSSAITLWINSPHLGFVSTSTDMTEEVNGPRITRTAHFEAGVVPAPIQIRFGYQSGQLAWIYLPLLALALALTLIPLLMARAGFAPLAFSFIMLGTMVWMAMVAQLQADAPLRILLFGSPFSEFAALFFDLWPPLICVAIGIALGSRLRGGQHNSTFGEVFSAYAVIPLILTCVVGALPSINSNRGNWLEAACWLAAAPIFVLLRRIWNRIRARASVRQLTAGQLHEGFAALAARAGTPQVKLYVSFSARSQAANAFALPGRSIFLTAPLIRSLSKREVNAVMAHELSHARHTNRGAWTALCIAMLFCETPAKEFLYMLPGGLLAALILPIGMFFAAMLGLRKREFLADAKAARLTSDPRAMISSLARIARNNDRPLQMNKFVEWFASHPSTPRRIQALAAAWRLDPAEVQALTVNDDPGEHYEIPAQESAANLFTPAWQSMNAGIYGWSIVFGSCASGLLAAWLIEPISGSRIAALAGGVVLACALTKSLAATVMARNYAHLSRKLKAKLGVGGQIVGLAPDSQARIYGAYRFSDAGLLRFENGRLCYQSERITIALNPIDVVEVGMVAAAPSSWFRRQPMVRFRNPESGQIQGFILHPVDWLATQQRLFRSIQRWTTSQSVPDKTLLQGFNPVAGQPFRSPPIAGVARGFIVTGGITLAAAIVIGYVFHAPWRFAALAPAITGCAYLSMMLPGMLYRSQEIAPEPASQAENA